MNINNLTYFDRLSWKQHTREIKLYLFTYLIIFDDRNIHVGFGEFSCHLVSESKSLVSIFCGHISLKLNGAGSIVNYFLNYFARRFSRSFFSCCLRVSYHRLRRNRVLSFYLQQSPFFERYSIIILHFEILPLGGHPVITYFEQVTSFVFQVKLYQKVTVVGRIPDVCLLLKV